MVRRFVAGGLYPAILGGICLLAVCAGETYAQENETKWQSDLVKARAIARAANKPLFIVFR